MKFLFITNDPAIARHAYHNGAEWVMVDLEKHGKQERQGHLDTVMSAHSVDDVATLREVLPPGSLLVRLDPINQASAQQVDAAIEAGADWLMLPFFHGPDEVAHFCRMVGGRRPVMLLAETPGACDLIAECCAIDGVERVHIGLNDLSLLTKRNFMFQLLTDGTVDRVAAQLRAIGMPFGIGGVARVGEGDLLAEDIVLQHVRLGSDAAILSRTFHRRAERLEEIEADMNFAAEVEKLRLAFRHGQNLAASQLDQEHLRIAARIDEIAAKTSAKPGR